MDEYLELKTDALVISRQIRTVGFVGEDGTRHPLASAIEGPVTYRLNGEFVDLDAVLAWLGYVE